MATTTVSRDIAQATSKEILDAALSGKDVVVRCNGEPVLAIIPYEDYLALQDELENLRDSRLVDQLEARLAAGDARLHSHDEVWAAIDELERKGALPD